MDKNDLISYRSPLPAHGLGSHSRLWSQTRRFLEGS